MYIYNVTTAVEPSIKDEWIEWMKNFFLPKMLSTGKFKEATLMEIITNEKEVCSFAVHYEVISMDTLKDYEQELKSKMEKMMWDKFADKALSFTTKLRKL